MRSGGGRSLEGSRVGRLVEEVDAPDLVADLGGVMEGTWAAAAVVTVVVGFWRGGVGGGLGVTGVLQHMLRVEGDTIAVGALHASYT